MSKVRILSGDGIGGQLQAFSCAEIVQNQGHEVHIGILGRNEIFNFLKEIFKDKFKNIVQVSEAFVEDYKLEKDEALWFNLSKGFDETYFICPDTLFRNLHRFNYRKYNVNLSDIKEHKLLQNKHIPQENLCYLSLLSTTPGYTYENASDLINFLCLQNPKWKFYIPINFFWNGSKLYLNIKQKHHNLIVDENPNLLNSWEYMTKASFAICTDGGPMHLFNHLGVEKLVLDPQFNNFPWIARWRKNMDDSIPILTSAIDIARLSKNLLDNELVRLLPRKLVLDRLLHGDIDFSRELLYKF